MKVLLQRLAPGIGLILIASLVLVLADLNTRHTSRQAPRVAIYQFATRSALDDSVYGCLQAFAEAGLVQGKHFQLTRYNPEGDLPTANAIARAIIDDGNDLVITFSTPALQTMASANAAGKIVHIFGAVTDPYSADAGISGPGPDQHPTWMTGIGTFQPVRDVFRLAREANPDLKVVGVVWDPKEACSEACVTIAREQCRKYGIRLLEAHVDNSAGVLEAARSLTARGVEALWVGGDNTVEASVESIVSAATAAGIPVFTNAPAHSKTGALINLGANYREVGRLVGQMAVRVLKGEDPAKMAVVDRVPRQLAINLVTLKGLKGGWRVPQDMQDRAAILYDTDGKLVRQPEPNKVRFAGKPKVVMVDYSESITVEEYWEGFQAQLHDMGIDIEKDILLKRHCAQGDMATLNTIIDEAKSLSPDVVVVTSTPALNASVGKLHDIPVVFGVVADPIAAGAGTSEDEHAPNITGASTMSDFEGMLRVVKECLPSVKTVGTVFTPSESNSVLYVKRLEATCREQGIRLITVPANSTSEVSEAALALAAKRPDAITQISDNVCNASFNVIAAAAQRYKVPLFGFVSSTVKKGALAAVAIDYQENGRLVAQMVVRILQGEQPKHMPFRPTHKTRMLVNPRAAASFGVTIPESVIKRAEKVVN